MSHPATPPCNVRVKRRRAIPWRACPVRTVTAEQGAESSQDPWLPWGVRMGHAPSVSHLAGDPSATLVVLSGLPAVGKTTIASLLARQIRAAHVRIDTIEQALVEATPLVQPLGPLGYVLGHAVATDQLRNHVSVVADSVNPLAVTRLAWREVGTRHAVRTVEVEVICSDPDEHRRRAETRASSVPGLVLPTWQQILDREYEPWDHPPLIVDTACADIDTCVANLRRRASL
jgi:predicted kinase